MKVSIIERVIFHLTRFIFRRKFNRTLALFVEKMEHLDFKCYSCNRLYVAVSYYFGSYFTHVVQKYYQLHAEKLGVIGNTGHGIFVLDREKGLITTRENLVRSFVKKYMRLRSK